MAGNSHPFRAIGTLILLFALFHPSLLFGEGSWHYVHFPEDCHLGVLSAREPGSIIGEWEEIGEARGTVVVPANRELMLKVYRDNPELAALANVNGRDLHGLLFPAMCEMDGTDLGYIEGLVALKELDLSHNKITDSALIHMEGLAALECLDLGGTKITDAGLTHIRGLHSLKELDLSFTEVGDAGIAHIKGLTSLRKLWLQDTNVTNAGLIHLQNLKSLQSVNLIGTRTSAGGLADLQAALPGCLVAVYWTKRGLVTILSFLLLVVGVALFYMPGLNRDVLRERSKILILSKSCLASVLVWIGPLLLSEINAFRFERFRPWHMQYLIILLLAIIYGIAIFASFQFLGRFKNERIIEPLIIAAFLFMVFSAFVLSVRGITGAHWSILLSGPAGVFVSAVMGVALGRIHSQLLSEPVDDRYADICEHTSD